MASGAAVSPLTGKPSPQVDTGARRIDPFEIAALALFAAVSMWALGLDVWQAVAHGRIWTGTDGVLPQDQMQYLAWVRDASHHAAASDLFVLRHTPADYFQPAIAISGGLTAIGVPAWLALLAWKPVAIAAVLIAARAYVRRALASRPARVAALVLGLFFGSVGITEDLWLGFWSWGYPFGLMALAAALGALLAFERDRAAAAALLGALASALHPWQGEILIVVLLGSGLLVSRDRRRWRALAVAVVATAIPLLYYAALSRADLAWRLAHRASTGSFSLPRIALALAPLALPALLAYRRRPGTFIAAATRVWPPAALAVFLFSETSVGSTPMHAWLGITIPLAVLAVEGVRSIGWPSFVTRGYVVPAVAVVVLTVPAAIHELRRTHTLVSPTPGNPNFIAEGERNALDYLDRDPQPGGVLTRFYLGTVVPAETGRRTYVGNCYWSLPACDRRGALAERLLSGHMRPRSARAFVRSTGARFVLTDCRSSARLRAALAPITSSVHRFGCAGVYVIRAGMGPTPAAALRERLTRSPRAARPAGRGA